MPEVWRQLAAEGRVHAKPVPRSVRRAIRCRIFHLTGGKVDNAIDRGVLGLSSCRVMPRQAAKVDKAIERLSRLSSRAWFWSAYWRTLSHKSDC